MNGRLYWFWIAYGTRYQRSNVFRMSMCIAKYCQNEPGPSDTGHEHTKHSQPGTNVLLQTSKRTAINGTGGETTSVTNADRFAGQTRNVRNPKGLTVSKSRKWTRGIKYSDSETQIALSYNKLSFIRTSKTVTVKRCNQFMRFIRWSLSPVPTFTGTRSTVNIFVTDATYYCRNDLYQRVRVDRHLTASRSFRHVSTGTRALTAKSKFLIFQSASIR